MTEEQYPGIGAIVNNPEKLADELVNVIEDNIPKLKREYPSLEEALDIAIQPGDGPVVLADASDNPGAGGLGDTTHISINSGKIKIKPIWGDRFL